MAHVIDYNKPVSNITITLLTNDDDPYANDLIQHVSKLVGNALVELRIKFPREKWEYFGVHYEEWLAGEPMDDPYLVSEGLSLKALWEQLGDIPVDEEEGIEEPFIHFPVGTNYMEIWQWFDKQDFEFPWKKGLSREKITLIPPDLPPSDEGGLAQKEQENSPSVDKEDVTEEEAFVFGIIETSHEESREDVIAEGIESKNLRINEGVASFLITRKYFPLEKCISCYQKNTDFCRLVCESEAEGDVLA